MLQDKNTTSFLVKIGSKEHLEKLLDGQIYCNTLHFFAKSEDDTGRNDMNEIRFEYLNFPNVDGDNGHLQISKQFKPEVPCGNLFCLYNYTVNHPDVNKKYPLHLNAKIDSHCVVIQFGQIFIDRVLAELDKRKFLNHRCGYVKYEDLNKHVGFKSPFVKDLKYRNQNEYRFYIPYDKLEPIKLNIGNIRDIAHLETIEEFEGFSLVNFDIEKLVKDKNFS